MRRSASAWRAVNWAALGFWVPSILLWFALFWAVGAICVALRGELRL